MAKNRELNGFIQLLNYGSLHLLSSEQRGREIQDSLWEGSKEQEIREYEAFAKSQREGETEKTSDSCSDSEKSDEKGIFSEWIG